MACLAVAAVLAGGVTMPARAIEPVPTACPLPSAPQPYPTLAPSAPGQDFPAYQPPPLGFDAARGEWLVSLASGGFAATWRTALDGSGSVLLVDGPATRPIALRDGRIVYGRPETAAGGDSAGSRMTLVVSHPGGADERALDVTTSAPFAVAPGTGAVIAEREDAAGDDLGLWRVPVDGGEPTRLMPPPAARASEGGGTLETVGVFATADGRRVVRASGPGETGAAQRLDARFDGISRRLHDGFGLGFDVGGRFLYLDAPPGQAGRVLRIAPGRRVPERVATVAGGSEVRLAGGGRWLASLRTDESAGQDDLAVVDAATGRSSRWALPGAWELSAYDGPDVVGLEGGPAGSGWRAVVDPAAGWIGYLPAVVVVVPPCP
jgi:hypothetical protein